MKRMKQLKRTVETVEGTDEVKYWVTNDDGTRVLASRNVPKSDKPKSPSKTSKSSESKKTTAHDDDESTTYWITDEYGIKRKVNKDFEVSYNVDEYGHSQYISNKSDVKCDSSKSAKKTQNTEEVKYWVTNDDGIRVLASKTVPKRECKSSSASNDKSLSNKSSKSSGPEITKNDPLEDESTSYWITDEYGIKRQVTKDYEASYSVDQFGRRQYDLDATTNNVNDNLASIHAGNGSDNLVEPSYYITDSGGNRKFVTGSNLPISDNYQEEKFDTHGGGDQDVRKKKSSRVTFSHPAVQKEDEEDRGKKITYWMTDEFGIQRQVAKDFAADYCVDQYGHRSYTPSDWSETSSAHDERISKDTERCWVTGSDGIRREVPMSRKPSSGGRRQSSTRANTKSSSSQPVSSCASIQDKSSVGETYWITDEYGIRRQVDKDHSASYSVDQFGHKHYS